MNRGWYMAVVGLALSMQISVVVAAECKDSPAVPKGGVLDCDKIENSVGMQFVKIPGGSFIMGDNQSGALDERPEHRVNISPFYMGATEVTQRQWSKVMGGNPSLFNSKRVGEISDNNPVEQVSWYDIQKFIDKLNKLEGTTKYRLPTEAEWEYAARAGSRGSYGAGVTRLERHAWISDNAGERTHQVGKMRPNRWGLHDMHGNVWEWTQDCWHDSYEGAPEDGSAWVYKGCDRRVMRGGSWNYGPDDVRSASRYGGVPSLRFDTDGFRLARDI